ncbi:MAG: hypothetical protein J07HQW1_00993 [Haloquadratum walsbyi J07HQW1]|uniref:Uncharacterized protein n=1 Tax=Haloquadratum walsbyi J07HQW1 TaxID=1238424 RepID=U1PBN3_9EURY|nr:MAG: hypothetical protein J07HQW1_00993 [Haloquadratum walsbyi J07HQW1]
MSTECRTLVGFHAGSHTLVARPERACAGNGEGVHAEVNAKHRPVRGRYLVRRGRLYFLLAVDMELPLAVLPMYLRPCGFVLAGEQVFSVGRIAIFVR